MRKIALQVHLRLLAVRRRGQRDHAKHPGAHPLRDGADRTPLAGGVPTLEHDDHAEPLVLHPVLEPAQLGLQLAQRLVALLSAFPGASPAGAPLRHLIEHQPL
jgi:hypothetical protein